MICKGTNKYNNSWIRGNIIKKTGYITDLGFSGKIDSNNNIYTIIDGHKIITGKKEGNITKRTVFSYLIGVTEINPNKIYEYTGYVDIVGKEIFTGDLVWYKNDVWLVTIHNGSLVLIHDANSTSIKEDRLHHAVNNFKVEVIGNYNDNEKLIKGKIRILDEFEFFRYWLID